MLVPATTVPVTIIGAFAGDGGARLHRQPLHAVRDRAGDRHRGRRRHRRGRGRRAQYRAGHDAADDAAIAAMDELFGPIIGITLVLMSVFLPAAFLPGLTGQMYAQFALVIAATALISAINAVTLKPTQCALWLRPPVPPEKRNFVLSRLQRGLRAVSSSGYARLDRGAWSTIAALMVRRRARRSSARALYGFSRIADRLPADRGPGLPDRHRAVAGRRLARAHPEGARRGSAIAGKMPGVDACDHHRRRLGARQQRDAGECRRRLRHPEGAGASAAKGEDLLSLFTRL